MKKKVIISVSVLLALVLVGLGVTPFILRAKGEIGNGSFFRSMGDITEIDLSEKPENLPEELSYLYEFQEVEKIDGYLAHPDAVLLKNGDILQMFPKGHGRGAVLTKLSSDGGLTYDKALENTPESWEKSLETPTVYRLEFKDGSEKIVMTSANPDWERDGSTPGGFNCSVSSDDGKTWSEFELFYPKDEENGVVPIVAMASLTRLKENGEFVDKWMGFFHGYDFCNYKSILTFDENGNPQWSVPEKYFAQHRAIEEKSQMCEVEVIRSDKGQGDELCLLTRSNTKQMNSLVSFSQDEGKTWSEPKALPNALSGERFKAEYTPDGRLAIAFRSINRDTFHSLRARNQFKRNRYYSEGPILWVGTYEDLKNGTDGQYRIKLAHTYYDSQKKPAYIANPDTGYCGNVVLPDGTVVISNYGKFSPDETYVNDKGETTLKTYITSKRLRLDDVDKLAKFLEEK